MNTIYNLSIITKVEALEIQDWCQLSVVRPLSLIHKVTVGYAIYWLLVWFVHDTSQYNIMETSRTDSLMLAHIGKRHSENSPGGLNRSTSAVPLNDSAVVVVRVCNRIFLSNLQRTHSFGACIASKIRIHQATAYA